MKISSTNALYLRWLKNQVGAYTHYKGYSELLAYLFKTPYIPLLEDDKNRAQDGIDLRRYFFDDRPHLEESDLYCQECNMFEMLLGLAKRMAFITMSADRDDQICKWFWIMIRNMGLLRLDNEQFDEEIAYKTVRDFLNGAYGSDGERGPFYFSLFKLSPFADSDITQTPLWTQAMWYIDWISGADRL